MIKSHYKAIISATIFIILTVFTATTSSAQNTSRARLAVIISINGLESYELENFTTLFEDGGLKRIINSGYYDAAATSNYMPSDATTDYASIMCGTTPHYHGIVSSHFYSMLDDDIISCIEDARYDGINTKRTVSPKLLQATTIGDQLKLCNPQSKVYSIALSAESALMMGGHLADGVVWIDDETGRVATTFYYDKGLPQWSVKINNDNSIPLLYKNWTSLNNILTYKYPISKNYYVDLHPILTKLEYTEEKKDVATFKQTPFVNELIKDLAVRAIRDDNMGDDDNPDLLCVEFTANHAYSSTPMSAENEDFFIRLDKTIKQLIDIIDISVGLENSVIVLTAPTNNINVNNDNDTKKINGGVFNSYRATALLNAYLMAIYGQGRWVTGYYNRNIHLNKTLIEENKIKLNDIEDYVAQFMMEFSGVMSAVPSYQIQATENNNNRMSNSYYKNRTGDVIISLLPGWREENNKFNAKYSTIYYPTYPLAIWYKGTTPEKRNITIEDICPTLCRILQIPYPNACIGTPLIFK